MGHPSRVTIEPGIRRDRYGYEASVRVDGKCKTQRFPHDTPLAVIRRWRVGARDEREIARFDAEEKASSFPKSPEGWCYLYVIRSGERVKVGRAVDLAQRFANLQSAHHAPLKLVAAAPIHSSLEPLIHLRLQQWRVQGEWYLLAGEVLHLIAHLRAHRNPVAFVWPDAEREAWHAVYPGGGPVEFFSDISASPLQNPLLDPVLNLGIDPLDGLGVS